MNVSFQDCVDQLVCTEQARGDLSKWVNRSYVYRKAGFPALEQQQDEFRDRVRGFTHTKVFEISSSDVMATLARTARPLGDMDKTKDEKKLTEEAPWPFSFSYYFHSLLERTGSLPIWQEVWNAAWHGEFRGYYRDAMPDSLQMAANKLGRAVDLSPAEMERSAQWRLGKYYYSALREIYLHATLRERFSINLRYHLFADVRLFVDGWTADGALLCLRLRNWREIRKGEPETWKPPHYSVVRAGAPFGERGKAWLPSDDTIAEVARLILEGKPGA